jgi:hypothetical protein
MFQRVESQLIRFVAVEKFKFEFEFTGFSVGNMQHKLFYVKFGTILSLFVIFN